MSECDELRLAAVTVAVVVIVIFLAVRRDGMDTGADNSPSRVNAGADDSARDADSRANRRAHNGADARRQRQHCQHHNKLAHDRTRLAQTLGV